MRNLDIDLLRTFVAIAQHETFAAAAARVGRTQSAVTQQMQRLEEEMGCALFEKRGRHKMMTPDGVRLVAYAHKILALNDQAVQVIQTGGPIEKIRIGSPHDVADSILPNLLRRLSKLSPELQMEINVGRSPFLMDALRDKTLDLAISTRYDDAFPGIKLRTSPMVWICAEDFIFNPAAPVPLVMADELSLFRQLSIECLYATRISASTSKPGNFSEAPIASHHWRISDGWVRSQELNWKPYWSSLLNSKSRQRWCAESSRTPLMSRMIQHVGSSSIRRRIYLRTFSLRWIGPAWQLLLKYAHRFWTQTLSTGSPPCLIR
jgi:DNA-binding transcriptional LysR family regulator